MKHIKILLAICSLLIIGAIMVACNQIAGSQEGGEEKSGTDGLEFYPINDSECAVSAGSARLLEEIVIPERYGNYIVTSILGNNVSNVDTLDNSIGGFANCTNLKKITIPKTIKSIGDAAFYNCFNLQSIEIPDGISEIGDYAFANCKNLTSIIIPESTKNVSYAFLGCERLADVYYKGTIGQFCVIDVFGGWGNRKDGYNLYIDNKLLTVAEIPYGVKDISSEAFRRCASLSSVVIPASVRQIGFYSFAECRNLVNLVFTDGCSATLFYGQFESCVNLCSITIPTSIARIETGTFKNCGKITDVYYLGNEEQWENIWFGPIDEEIENATQHYNYIVE